jgi:hypothetical protein
MLISAAQNPAGFAFQFVAQERPEDGERAVRKMHSLALLSALRSFRAPEFRPGEPPACLPASA